MLWNKPLSPRTYNLLLGGLILYGLLANLLMAVLCAPIFSTLDPIALSIGWLVCVVIGVLLVLTKKLWARILAYHLVVIPFGPILSTILGAYTGSQILLAIALTAVITGGMILLSTRFPRFFSRLGTALLISLLLALLVSFVTWMMNVSLSILSVVFVVIFSLYIGYDWYCAQRCEKTVGNAIDCAIDLYLDIINIFVDLLDLADLLDIFS